jgi:uncharacterized Zn finger protein (UPF0148 family)
MWANSCPCCGSALLRHARRQGVYWFCPSCHQEMMPLVTGQLVRYIETRKSHTLQSAKS